MSESWYTAGIVGFGLDNLPFGVARRTPGGPRIVLAFEDRAVDLLELFRAGWLELDAEAAADLLGASSLNPLLARGLEVARDLRRQVQRLLGPRDRRLRDAEAGHEAILPRRESLEMLRPIEVADYVDFYASLDHARNVGALFRDPANPLPPNWRHLPIGYHGRAGTVIVSGEEITRPWGQIERFGEVRFGPTEQLDYELEVGFVVGADRPRGRPLSVDEADDYLFGALLVNDWSARDIQRWEYRPLGPFLGKSFATSLSPWVVTMEALEPFRCAGPPQEPPPLPYLAQAEPRTWAIDLEADLVPASETEPTPLCRTSFGGMYWSIAQQLAHLTSNGASLRIGDLLASGTVSGSEPGRFGSLLETTRAGAVPLRTRGGGRRTYLEDGDTVILRGTARREGRAVSFGACRGRVVPP